MVSGQFSDALSRLRRRFGHAPAGAEDAVLLGRFAEHRDEGAFVALLQCHGPMVLGVCRRVLGHEQDAEDVFQATFLVLARRAASIRGRGALAGWLYRVATRMALAVRTASSRRRTVERQAAPMRQTDPTTETDWRDLRPVLDEELSRLPEKYRLPVVLCYLEHKTHAEAAGELGWPCGTVAGRLARARELLRGRLARRGVGLPSAVLATLLVERTAPAAVPAVVLRGTLQAALGFLPAAPDPRAAAPAQLAEGMLRTMQAARRNLAALFCLLTLLATGAGTAALLGPARHSPRAALAEPQVPKGPRIDRLGDPLPPGAVARLGTTRFQHAGNLFGPAFAPDGKTFVTADGYGLVRLWDRATGKELRRFLKRYDHFRAIALASGGRIAVVVASDGLLRRWDVASGKDLKAFQPGLTPGSRVVFSPDGKRLAAAPLGGEVSVLDPATGKEVRRLRTLERAPAVLAFSPDGKRLAVGGRRLEIWEADSGRLLHRVGTEAVQHLAFSADGKTLATWGGPSILLPRRGQGKTPATSAGNKGNPIYLWDVSTGKQVARLPALAETVTGLALAPGGKVLFVSIESTTLMVDLPSGKEKRRLGQHRSGANLTLSPDGKVLAVSSWDGTLRLWDAATGEPLLRLPGHRSWVAAVAYAPDGKTVATGGGDGTARLWNARTGKELRRFEGSGVVWNLSFSPDCKLLAGGCEDAVRVWEVATGKEKRRAGGYASGVFAPGGKLIASAVTGKSAIALWEPATGKVVRRLGPVGKGSETLHGLSFAPDGKSLAAVLRETADGAAAPGDAVVYVWDVASGEELRALTRPEFGVMSLAFSPDGRTLAAGTEQGTLHLWDARTGKEQRVRRLHPYQVYGLAFSADGRTLATAGGEDGRVRLWEVATGRERGHFPGHHPTVTSVAFAPDGRTVASGSEDGTALVWDLAKLGRPPR